MTDQFVVPKRLKTTGTVLAAIGVLTLIVGGIILLNCSDAATAQYCKTRFWAVLLHNSVFFTLMMLASVFIMAAAQLAQGAWIVSYRRIPEAIGANVGLFGAITVVILLLIVFVFNVNGHNPIYHWVHPEGDRILEGKKAFLNPIMFTGFTLVTVGLWAYFGKRFQKLSLEQDRAPKGSKRIYWKTVTVAGIFLVVFALTQMSTTPWLWLMSINAHWFSTMYSWYTFASAFVAGMGLILLWVTYLKNQGNLELVTTEHLHDLGKFQFAFSIFWTYLWFCQFMLIWYGNIPEETIYFKIRMQGPYSFIWFSVFIINFIAPILVLMSRPSKRNYFTVSFMAMIILFGHWLDYYIMVMPEPLGAHFHIGWYELGILAGFAGLLILTVSRTLAKHSLVPVNNPLLKESILLQS